MEVTRRRRRKRRRLEGVSAGVRDEPRSWCVNKGIIGVTKALGTTKNRSGVREVLAGML